MKTLRSKHWTGFGNVFLGVIERAQEIKKKNGRIMLFINFNIFINMKLLSLRTIFEFIVILFGLTVSKVKSEMMKTNKISPNCIFCNSCRG